jgi:molecular chaperone DnaK (HSP70)
MILQQFGPSYSQNRFRYSLTVPAIWNDKAKDAMRKAAIRAGMISESDHPDRLMLISEPEAAALYCEKVCKQFELDHKDRFMICDAGGGTVDLIVYEISKTSAGRRLSEVTKGHGGMCGSMFIDKKLEQLLVRKFGNRLSKLPNNFITNIVEEFAYKNKPEFDGEDELFVRLPSNINFNDIEDPDSIGVDDGYIQLTASELKKEVFEPVVKQVIKLIREQLQGAKECSAIFLVGGFGSSSYLLNRVREVFGSSVRTIASPDTPEMAIVLGAVYAGLNPDMVTTRITRRCYGINVSRPFFPGFDPVSHLVVTRDSLLCDGTFFPMVRKGQAVRVDECFTDTVEAKNYCRDSSFKIPICAVDVDGEPPLYTTDPRVSTLGTIYLPKLFKKSDPLNKEVMCI